MKIANQATVMNLAALVGLHQHAKAMMTARRAHTVLRVAVTLSPALTSLTRTSSAKTFMTEENGGFAGTMMIYIMIPA